MRQPVPPRSTPGRSEAGAPGGQAGAGNVQAGALASASSSGGAMGQNGAIGSQLGQPHRVPAGGSSSQPERFSDRRYEGFEDQSYGGFQEGYYDGNNGFGNAFGPHNRDACSAVLCLYCEMTMHESKDCPLLSMPKPVAITYGVSRNELMFHEVPASAEVTFKHDSGKIGRISVTGGTLSAQEIINELQWIIPCNHQWDLTPTEDGAFKVIFPSKADLARITKIINVPVPDTNMFLHFEEWSAADLDKFFLSPVWVRVHGVCYKERCDYLSLFGVGSLIGKTKEVDMAFTRSHTMVRMLVEVTRVEHLPTTTVDHTYDGQGYGLLFKLESQPGKEKDDVVMNEVTPDDDAAEEKGKGKELPKGTNPTQGDASVSTQVPNTDRPQNNPNLSTQVGASMLVCRVGQIDYPRADPSCSDSKVYTLKPRKLWADYSSDEEDSTASPLPRLTSSDMKLSSSFHKEIIPPVLVLEFS
ncbi:hypothetical protein ACQ4PT_054098 [Festuca glaucescens]